MSSSLDWWSEMQPGQGAPPAPTRPGFVQSLGRRGAGPSPDNTSKPLGRLARAGGGEEELRAVVIDGSNVAMSHGNHEVFSCLGIQLAIDYFLDRGHSDVTVFVPSWRKEQPRPDVPITDQQILRDLERKKILVFTPSRRVAGRRVVCNDDRFIVKHAFDCGGVVVSNDTYRDLQAERPEWRRFIQDNLLMFCFVNNKFMPPDDPLGRHGPSLDEILRKFPKTQKKQPCPYGRKCNYGTKCRFLHPECGPVLLLGEDLEKKLSVGQEKGAKSSQCSGRRSWSRSEKSRPHFSSQDQLDSGLGSIDDGGRRSSSSTSHCPGPLSCPPGFPSAPLCYHGNCTCTPFSGQSDFRHGSVHQRSPPYWSDPLPAVSCDSASGQHPQWFPSLSPNMEQREAVRKKLLAIFSRQLVDTAMDLNPQLLDPQALVEEIQALQSQNPSLR